MEKVWTVYVRDNDYEGQTTILGVTCNLEAFIKLAKETFGINSEPIKDEFGRGSLHYEYTTKKIGVKVSFKQYYSLVAEPTKMI